MIACSIWLPRRREPVDLRAGKPTMCFARGKSRVRSYSTSDLARCFRRCRRRIGQRFACKGFACLRISQRARRTIGNDNEWYGLRHRHVGIDRHRSRPLPARMDANDGSVDVASGCHARGQREIPVRQKQQPKQRASYKQEISEHGHRWSPRAFSGTTPCSSGPASTGKSGNRSYRTDFVCRKLQRLQNQTTWEQGFPRRPRYAVAFGLPGGPLVAVPVAAAFMLAEAEALGRAPLPVIFVHDHLGVRRIIVGLVASRRCQSTRSRRRRRSL
jgi:hypothetical protein